MITSFDLGNIGFNAIMQKISNDFPDLFAARISVAHKNIYKAITANGEVLAEISGKLRHQAVDSKDLPAVGDFVMLDRNDNDHGNAIIHEILPRHSLFTRKSAGTSGDLQVIAANISTAFICMSMNRDFSPRRLERYISITWESGAAPVVVLTKSDLCDDIPAMLSSIADVTIGVEVLCTSSLSGDGIDAIMPWLSYGQTIAFLGSSGVGKSTLINKLLGNEMLATNEIRSDDKGRHTTTHRELIPISTGGCVIDTPGMRELGLESANLDKTFTDISSISADCRFGDCSHTNEPGCAVNAAIESGILSVERLKSYQKLQKELGYEGLNFRQIESKKLDSMLGHVGGMKNFRNFIKGKNKQKGRD